MHSRCAQHLHYKNTYVHTYLKICSTDILTYLKIRTYTMAGPLSGTSAAPCAVHSRCVQRPARETQREREREREEEEEEEEEEICSMLCGLFWWK